MLEILNLTMIGGLGAALLILMMANRRLSNRLAEVKELSRQAMNLVDSLDNDEIISRLQALCANYRYHIGALRAERKQLRLEVERLEKELTVFTEDSIVDPEEIAELREQLEREFGGTGL